MKGYPPSVFALIPSLCERAGIDRQTGGSVTALYTVLADGGDIEDPVVASARAIVDGPIIMSATFAEHGAFTAICVSRSLSHHSVTMDCTRLDPPPVPIPPTTTHPR